MADTIDHVATFADEFPQIKAQINDINGIVQTMKPLAEAAVSSLAEISRTNTLISGNLEALKILYAAADKRNNELQAFAEKQGEALRGENRYPGKVIVWTAIIFGMPAVIMTACFLIVVLASYKYDISIGDWGSIKKTTETREVKPQQNTIKVIDK